MSIRAIIFDIGGVLEVNPRTGWEQRWAAELGTEVDALAARLTPVFERGSIGRMDLSQVEQAIATTLGLSSARSSALMDDLWAEYLGTLNHELARYFAGLRPRYRTAILSNSFVGAREREQRLYGFEDMCDLVVYSHEEGLIKPDARLYRRACRRLGVKPAQAVFLDDVPACVAGARAVGMKAIRFVNNRQAIAELDALLRRRPPRD